MDIFKEIMDSIDILLSKKLKKVTKASYCIVKSINTIDKTCIISYMGNEFTVKFYGSNPIVNSKYPLILPDNNLSQAFVIG